MNYYLKDINLIYPLNDYIVYPELSDYLTDEYATMLSESGFYNTSKINAKILRKYVNDLKTNKKIMVVSSVEPPLKREGLSSLVFVPAVAGLLCSNYVIRDIIEN